MRPWKLLIVYSLGIFMSVEYIVTGLYNCFLLKIRRDDFIHFGRPWLYCVLIYVF
jgi:hypothetical protein